MPAFVCQRYLSCPLLCPVTIPNVEQAWTMWLCTILLSVYDIQGISMHDSAYA